MYSYTAAVPTDLKLTRVYRKQGKWHLLAPVKVDYKRLRISANIILKFSFKYRFIA
jgi:hypothetical protein